MKECINCMKKKTILLFILLSSLVLSLFYWIYQQTSYDWELPPLVQVDGHVYNVVYETNLSFDESQYAGTINSYVSSTEFPGGDDQSNFPSCVGQPYVWEKDQLYVFFELRWHKGEEVLD